MPHMHPRAAPAVLLVVAVILIAACAPLRPSGAGRGAAAAAAREADPLAAPWVVRHNGMRRTQRVEVRSLLTSQVDSFVRVDTLRSLLEVAWSAVPGTTPPRVVGLVSDLRTALGSDMLSVPAAVTLPFSFTAEQHAPNSQPAILIPDAAACGSTANAAVLGVQETWSALPDTLWPGRAWGDSSHFEICRDGIPLLISTIREFTPTEARLRDGQMVVLVSRRSRSRVVGAGTQFGETVSLQGGGEGVMLLEVALVGGVVLRGEGTSELRLEMRGSRRVQRLVQESRLLVREP